MLAQPEELVQVAGTTQDGDLPRIKVLFEDLRMKHARLMGLREADLRRKADIEQKVALAKGRRELAPEINLVLEKLQAKAHRRSLGVYEELLTACMHDVLPDTGRIALKLGKDRGMPALDIQMMSGPDNLYAEDILESNGGSVNNVVVAGLKISALARIKDNRRLLVLDEPDAWLKPAHVPNFMKMLSEAAIKSDTQMLVISHHGAEYFEGYANIVKLYAEDGVNKAMAMEPRLSNWPDNTTPGLRSLQLINVRKHKDTFIPFFPHMNGFIGDNNLGKSTAVITALRAVAYNDSDDTLFPHPDVAGGEQPSESKIILTFEESKRIELTRYLKKSPKVVYRIFHGEDMVFEGRPETRGRVPAEVEALMGIRKMDGLDIQLVSQKSPIFLLDETPSDRAKLLSVGQESGHLHAIWDGYRKLAAADKATIKEGEEELTRLSARLPALDRLVPLAATVSILGTLLKNIDNASRQDVLLERIITSMEQAKALLESSKLRMSVLTKLPKQAPVLADNSRLAALADQLATIEPKVGVTLKPLAVVVPVIEDIARIEATIDRLQALKAKSAILLPEMKVTVPNLGDNSRLRALGVQMAALAKTIGMLEHLKPVSVAVPVVNSEADNHLARLIHEMTKLQADGAGFKAELERTQAEEIIAKAEQERLKAACGNFCPVCEGSLPEKGLVHEHAH